MMMLLSYLIEQFHVCSLVLFYDLIWRLLNMTIVTALILTLTCVRPPALLVLFRKPKIDMTVMHGLFSDDCGT